MDRYSKKGRNKKEKNRRHFGKAGKAMEKSAKHLSTPH
jgi:hypothetical protein